MVALFQVIRRATDCTPSTRPVREVIYTVVSREDLLQGEGVHRHLRFTAPGDQVGAWSAPLLMGMSLWAAPLAAIAIAALWLVQRHALARPGASRPCWRAAGPHG